MLLNLCSLFWVDGLEMKLRPRTNCMILVFYFHEITPQSGKGFHDQSDHLWVFSDDNVSWLSFDLNLAPAGDKPVIFIFMNLDQSFTGNKRGYSEHIGVIRAGCWNKWTKWTLRGLGRINTNHLLFLNEMQRYKAPVKRSGVTALLESEAGFSVLIVQVMISTDFWKCNIVSVK